MLKYYATSVALKAFSCGPLMRGLYRRLGNQVGNKKRGAGPMPQFYVDRLQRMIRLWREHGFVRDGDRVLELGTGWLHWEAISLRLFFEFEAVLYDVWDNRQLPGLKNYLSQLRPMLGQGFGLTPAEIKRAQSLIDVIVRVQNFEELYAKLKFEYVVESTGSLRQFQNESFQVVVSGGVLEHIYRAALPEVASESFRILAPGGWAVHSVDTSDHLAHYDSSVCKKQYLSLSETQWKWLCENDVQYINRLQRCEWLDLFKHSGLELIEEDSRSVDISQLKIAERYRHLDQKDLACTVLRLVARKPGAAPKVARPA